MTAAALSADVSEAPVIEARGIVKTYGGAAAPVAVLKGVDLTIQRGEVVALLGRSGSGKSTLLNILGCLDRPDGGTYLLGGSDVSKLGPREQAWVRLHYIGFVFQSFHLIPRATALDNVALPLYYAGVGRAEREEAARRLLGRVGLAERVLHRPSELSGGQKQRVALARALACGPKLLLADEPTGALDTKAGEEILQLLGDLRKSDALTIALVTHDTEVASTADRRVILCDGRIVGLESDCAPVT
jgi:ABC-type lipoprotein export system ATPase subunit